MPEDAEQVQQLRDRVRELEELLHQLPILWVRCLAEGNFSIGLPGTASHEFMKLIYKIEKTLPLE